MEVNSPASINARKSLLSADDILSASAHRPWPLPSRPWAMRQVWSNLLFAHWPTDVNNLAALLPPGITLDTWEGDAWVGIVPFQMPYLSIRGVPNIPAFTHLLETNVRTYVRVGDKPGVYFFSLDADNPIVVEAARRWFYLPYLTARFTCEFSPKQVDYEVNRTDSRAKAATFSASYRPVGPAHTAAPDSFEEWLTARYALYTVNRRGRVLRGDVTHKPWSLAPAEAEIRANTLAQSHGIALADTTPWLHYADRVDVLAWTTTPAK